jgi:uncharacterized membrane protein YcjF (UPF0283 family)
MHINNESNTVSVTFVVGVLICILCFGIAAIIFCTLWITTGVDHNDWISWYLASFLLNTSGTVFCIIMLIKKWTQLKHRSTQDIESTSAVVQTSSTSTNVTIQTENNMSHPVDEHNHLQLSPEERSRPYSHTTLPW